MKKLIVWKIVACICIISNVHAERYIQSTKYENQEEFFIKGGSYIVSNKINSVLMYQTSDTIKNNRGNFYFKITNRTENPINFYISNLRVTDQWGRHVRIVSKKEQIENKKRSRNWALFASALCTGLESFNAQNAGNVTYQSQTYGTHSSNFNVHGSGGCANSSAYGHSTSTTTGAIQVEALRQQAQRQVREDALQRNDAIQGSYEDWEYRLNNFYLDTTTIFPGDAYAANFQIDMNKNIEKDLEYLLFTYHLNGEEHTFGFYCGRKKKKWCRFRF